MNINASATSVQYTVYGCNDQQSACQQVYQPGPEPRQSSSFSFTLSDGASAVLPPSGSANAGTYWLGVHAPASTNFTILATQRSSSAATVATQLSDGYKLPGEMVAPGQPEYYIAQFAPWTRVQLVVDVCYGSGQLSASTTNPYPAPSASSLALGSGLNVLPSYPTNATGYVYLAVSATSPVLSYEVLVVNAYTDAFPISSAAIQQFVPRLSVTTVPGGFDAVWTAASANAGFTASYTLYYTSTSDPSNVYTLCGCSNIQSSLASGKVSVTPQAAGSSVSYSARGLPTGSYKVNVVASASSGSSPVIGYAPVTVSVSASAGYGYSSSTIAAITVPIVLIVVGVVLYLCYRNGKFQAQQKGVDLSDVATQQISKAAQGLGFRRRAQARLNKPGKSRYNRVGFGLEQGTEMSVSELGLGDDDEDGDGMDGLYGEGEEGVENHTYTLDAVLETMEADEAKAEESLTFDS